jgi:hypothetical protein
VRRGHEREDDEMESAPGEPPAGEHLGQLRLRVEPADASVYVDGALPRHGTRGGSAAACARAASHRGGEAGLQDGRPGIEVAPGETTQLSVTLERPSI